MRFIKVILILAVLIGLFEACNRKGMRIRTAGKDREENLKEEAKKDSIPINKPDSLTEDVKKLKAEQYMFLTNLIINNMVRAQQAAYDGRYSEAEKLLQQTLKWYPTADALMLLGSVYEVQGRIASADSCWLEARRLDPKFDERAIELPQRGGNTPTAKPKGPNSK